MLIGCEDFKSYLDEPIPTKEAPKKRNQLKDVLDAYKECIERIDEDADFQECAEAYDASSNN